VVSATRLARVLAHVEELEDVGVPRLEVDGKRARSLVAALVDVARRVVVHAQHRQEAVRHAVRLQINESINESIG